jgi:hypothetical protein
MFFWSRWEASNSGKVLGAILPEPVLRAPDYQLVVAGSGPTLGFAVFVNHQRLRTWRQYLQRLQKFNHSVLLIPGQSVKCLPL